MVKYIKKFLKCIIKNEEDRIRIRWFVYSLQGKRYYFKKQLKIETIQIGNSYGGQKIVPPSDKDKPIIVLSFGIGEDTSFDEDILKNYCNAKIYAFDPTPRAISYVESKHFNKDRFQFFSYGLERFDGPVTFKLPAKDDIEPSGSVFDRERLKGGIQIKVEMRRLKTIMEQLDISHIDILKMDIEGSEFAVIDDILECDISFTQLCIEFHERLFSDGKNKMKKSINNLNRHGYSCCAVSSYGFEATFIKRGTLL